jgi:hypothetical protein
MSSQLETFQSDVSMENSSVNNTHNNSIPPPEPELGSAKSTRQNRKAPLRRVSEVKITDPHVKFALTKDEPSLLADTPPSENVSDFLPHPQPPPLRQLSEIEILEPMAVNDDDLLQMTAPATKPEAVRRVSTIEINKPLRQLSEIEVVEPVLEEEEDLRLAAASEPEAVRRVSVVEVKEPPPNEPSLADVAGEDYMVDTSSPTQQHRKTFRPENRGMLQIPDVKNVSMTRIEEPLEPVTASAAHDLTSEGTERSEEDFLTSPTSVATKKISPALLRDVSLVKVQEPNLSAANMDEFAAALPATATTAPSLESKKSAVHSPKGSEKKSDKISVAGAAMIPGAVAVSPSQLKSSTSHGQSEDCIVDDIAIKTGERFRASAAPGATVPLSPSRERKSLKEEMSRHDGDILNNAVVTKASWNRRRRSTNDFTTKLPGAVPVSPRERGELKEEMVTHDESLLHDAVAIKTGSRHRRNLSRRTSTQSTNIATPGAVSVLPQSNDETLKDAMQRHDEGLLQDAIAIKSGQHRRSHRQAGGRRTSVNSTGAQSDVSDDSAHPNHAAESSRLRRRRLNRQMAKAVAAGDDAAMNAKMGEYDNLVRQKEGYVELEDDGGWSDGGDEGDLECQDRDTFYEEDEYDMSEYSSSDSFTDSTAVAQLNVDGTTTYNTEARGNGDSDRNDAMCAYVQPYSEWKAENAAKMRKRHCRYAIIVLAVALTVVGVVVGVVLAVTNQDNTSKELNPAQSPTSAPTVDINACVDASGIFYTQRYDELRSLVVNNSLGEPQQVDVPESTQRKALCWIAEGDKLQLAAEESNLQGILQRYTLAVFYYGLATINETVGLATTNFLTPVNECTWKGVSCNTRNAVIALSIYNEDLIGSLPAEIGNLKNAGTLLELWTRLRLHRPSPDIVV